MVQFLEEAAVVELRAGVGILLILHGTSGNAGRGEAMPEVEGVVPGCPLDDVLVQFGAVLPPAQRVAEALVSRPPRPVDHGGQRLPFSIGADIDRDPSVLPGAGVDVVRGVRWMLISL